MVTLREYIQQNNVQVSEGTWNIGFSNSEDGSLNETQFDLDAGEGAETLEKLFKDFCQENGACPDSTVYHVGKVQ